VPPPRAAACSRAHRAAARHGRSERRPGLPGPLSGQARPPRPPLNPAARVRQRPPMPNAPSVASPASRPPGPSVEPSPVRQPPGPSPVSVVRVARPARPGFPTPPPEVGGDGRVRMDGGRHQTAGHRTGGQQTADRRTLWTTTPGDQTPDGWTAGSRTPKRDGWTAPAGHTGDRRPWRGCWRCRPRRRRPTARSWLDAPPGRRRLGKQPPGPLSSKDSKGTHAATDGPGPRRDRQLPAVTTVRTAVPCTLLISRDAALGVAPVPG
jgi:hypothetical protein